MKTDFSHDSPDHDPLLDEFFQIRELAPPDFAARTLEAAQRSQRQRRARLYRFSAWGGALAASLALLATLTISRPVDDPAMAGLESGTPEMAVATSAMAQANTGGAREAATTEETTSSDATEWLHSAQELTDLLHAAISETEQVMLYGQATELDHLLQEAIALADDEYLYTLDILILLAGN